MNLIKVTVPLVTPYLFQNFSRFIKDRVKVKRQLPSLKLSYL